MNCIDCGELLPEGYDGLRCQECVIALVEKMIARQHELTGEYLWRSQEMNAISGGRIENI